MRLPTRVADSPESWELLVSYMGPLDEHLRTDRAPNPLGRFLTGLLRRLGPTDAAVASIAEYFHRVGAFGTGQGLVRRWPLDDLPASLRDALY
jgi:hypothetical protein